MRDLILQRIRDCPTLPSLPAVALQVLELAQKDHADLTEIARIISRDPALSGKILKTVNSSFYGRSQSVGTISHALVILGLNAVKTLVLGFSLVTSLSRNKPKGFKHLQYWRRSVYAATAARLVAARIQLVQHEECFLAALLADLGMLVLDQVVGEPYALVNDRAAAHQKLPDLEYAEFGITHAEVSGLLASQWKFPPLLAGPMTYHHTPHATADPSLRKLAEVVNLAGSCAEVFVNENPAEAITHVRSIALERHKISAMDADAMLAEICERTREVAPLFEVSVSSATSYETILKKASDAIVELTLRSHREAQDLQQQNHQLKQQAATDPLTTLANRGQFDRFLADQFKAGPSAPGLALIMIDLDNFKNINDQHGHLMGDRVLKAVANLLKAAARPHDLAARYGGEELCLIMPATTKAAATTTAETIRRAIMARPISASVQAQIHATVSIGVAALEPTTPFREPAHLIKAADMAMYAAKKAGRNCVKVFSIHKPAAAPTPTIAS